VTAGPRDRPAGADEPGDGAVAARSVAIVSGGSRGLGLAVVQRLLARGDAVATFSRSGSPALDVLAQTCPGRLWCDRLDAADLGAVRGFVDAVVARFGRIDHCVANAAVAAEGVLATTTDAEIATLLQVNLAGSIVLVRECVRQFLVQPAGGGAGRAVAAGAPSGAPVAANATAAPSIVVVSSIVAARGSPGLAVYAATKAGLEGFARSLARELGSRGVRVNAVAPGFLETDLSASLPEAHRGRIARRTALGRLGTPTDVVGAIDWLTSPAAAFVTGQTVTIDGGS
jgi:3-oxoacyl-[acyl-carrier protein] reductase